MATRVSRKKGPEPFAELRVLSVASEAFPLIKTGGLGDVIGALPAAIRGVHEWVG